MKKEGAPNDTSSSYSIIRPYLLVKIPLNSKAMDQPLNTSV